MKTTESRCPCCPEGKRCDVERYRENLILCNLVLLNKAWRNFVGALFGKRLRENECPYFHEEMEPKLLEIIDGVEIWGK